MGLAVFHPSFLFNSPQVHRGKNVTLQVCHDPTLTLLVMLTFGNTSNASGWRRAFHVAFFFLYPAGGPFYFQMLQLWFFMPGLAVNIECTGY